MRRARIHFGGIEFEGGPGPATFTIEANGIKGLKVGGAGFRRDTTERPANHGDFASPSFRTGRQASWSGDLFTTDAMTQEHEIEKLEAMAGTGDLHQLTFESSIRSVWGMFGVDDLDVDIDAYGRIARYRIGVYASDPRLYGESRDYVAGTPALNFGNFEATPELRVGAGTGGYTITGPGGRVVTVTAAPAAAHVIDFAAGGLFLNAVRQPNTISVFQPWTVPVGLPGVVASISGARSLVQRVTDTFM